MVFNAGYSRTPLEKKLGFKDGFTIKLFNAPESYQNFIEQLPLQLVITQQPAIPADIIHYFTRSLAGLQKDLMSLKTQIKQDGMIWISWPKKTASLAADLNENDIREQAIKHQLVDVKVCAVDEVWSALKLVIPVKFRT